MLYRAGVAALASSLALTPGSALARNVSAASGSAVLSSACGMGQLSTLGDAALPRISDTQSSPQKPLEVVLKIDCRGVSLCPVRRDNLEFVEEKLLLSIDGQTFAKFSDKEIIAYVREHQGKLVDIELLNNDGSHQKDKLRLTYKLKNQLTDGYSLDWLKSNLRAIDGACEAPGWSQTLSGSGGTGVYLVDQAFCRSNLFVALNHPLASKRDVCSIATRAAVDSLTIGDFASATGYMSYLLPAQDSSSVDAIELNSELNKLLFMLSSAGLDEDFRDLGNAIETSIELNKKNGEFDGARFSRDEVIDFYKIYLNSLIVLQDKSALSIADRVFADKKLNFGASLAWVGNVYFDLGQYDKAKSSYLDELERLTNFEQINIKSRPTYSLDLYWMRQIAALHCRLGLIAMLTGDPAEAQAAFDRALAVYQSRLSKEQFDYVAKLSDFDPKPQDIALATTLLKAGGKKADLPEAVTLPIDEMYARYKLTAPQRQFIKLYRQLRQSIWIDAGKQAPVLVPDLLSLYRDLACYLNAWRYPFNMSAALPGLAYQLTERQSYEQSNQLLGGLSKTESITSDVSGREILLAVQKAVNARLAGVDDKVFWSEIAKNWNKEKASESEVIRQFAVLYAQAGQLRNGFLLLDVANERSLGSKANLDDEVFTRSMILLDRANLKATLLQYKDARSCFDQAFVVLKSLKSSGFKASDSNHAQLVYNKTRQLSALVRASGDLKSATEMLQLVLDLSKTDWSFINQFRERSDVSNTRGYAAVQLARLLMEQKQYALASKYLTETANDSGTKPPNMLLLVRARCAEAMQDYAAAAKDYASLASNYSPLTSYSDKAIKKGQETYFRLAIDNATKAKSFDPATLAVMRTALDKIIIEQPRTQSISPNVLLSSTLANASTTALVSAANDEIQAANYKKAYEYLKQAIESITVTQVAENIGLPAVGRSIDKFADTGHQEQAEALHVMLVQKIEALYGDKSIECCAALQNLVVFYLRQLNEPRLWPVLDRMLAIDQRRCEAGQYYDRVAYKPIDVFVSTKLKPAQCKLALAALSRMLEVSKKLYGDDGRVGKIYSQMATLEISMGDNSAAEEHLKKALGIEDLYGVDGFGSTYRKMLFDLLQKQGRQRECDLLKAAWIERDALLQKYRVNFYCEQNRDNMLTIYDVLQREAPYSPGLCTVAMALLGTVKGASDGAKAIAYATVALNAIEHNSLMSTGGCMPLPAPTDQRIVCLRTLIERNLALGNKQEANKWYRHAVAQQSYKPGIAELKFLTDIESLCGDKDKAIGLCRQLEATIRSVDVHAYDLNTVRSLYEKLGANSDYQRLNEEHVRTQKSKAAKSFAEQHAADKARKLTELKRVQVAKHLKVDDRALAVAVLQQMGSDHSMKLEFAPVESIKGRYSFDYAALADHSMSLVYDSYICVDPRLPKGTAYSFGATKMSLCCCQGAHAAGDLIVMYDGPPGSLLLSSDKAELLKLGGKPSPLLFTAPPPDLERPFRPALSPPPGAIPISNDGGLLKLKAGDYVADRLTASSITIAGDGRVRIFIKDTGDSKEEAFKTAADALVNRSARPHAERLEIWYNGKSQILLGDRTQFDGVIYAPHAEIRLGQDVKFCGAMVAGEIFAKSGCKISYDTALRGWVEPVGKH
ncbi:MAG: hypothetical protein KA255_11960 [Candidatus Obscuribacter sp.]|nr:hypothetical protein [Candidatus Obscuribacter sp.]